MLPGKAQDLDPSRLLTPESKASLSEEVQQVLTRIDDPQTKTEILGVVAQMSTLKGRTSNLLKVRFKEVISDNPARKELDAKMDDMQDSFADMDPEKLGRLNIVSRIFSRNPLAKRLKKMVQGYESAEKKIEAIEAGIAQGAKNLISDTNELLALHDQLTGQNKEIAQRVFVIGGVSQGLEAKRAAEPSWEPDVRFEHRLRTSVQDMKLMFLVNSQFKESIMMTVTNNQELVEGSERLATVAGGMVRSGLALQSALIRQQQVIRRNRSIKEFLETLMETNAKTIHDNTLSAAESTSGPLLDIEKVKSSYQLLRATAEELDKLRARTALESLQVVDTIDKVTADLKALPGLRDEVEAAKDGV
jgi:uncharacterized protein YaaN involved in tellurite resistance